MSHRTLFVGLGSPHGDDRVGLCVAEEMASREMPAVEVRLAATPSELLDWLDDAERLMVCDACLSDEPAGTLHRWKWPATEIEATRFVGSHDLPLPAVLTLAARLGRLPPEVTIWGIAIGRAQPGESLSLDVATAIPEIVDQIRGAIDGA